MTSEVWKHLELLSLAAGAEVLCLGGSPRSYSVSFPGLDLYTILTVQIGRVERPQEFSLQWEGLHRMHDR